MFAVCNAGSSAGFMPRIFSKKLQKKQIDANLPLQLFSTTPPHSASSARGSTNCAAFFLHFSAPTPKRHQPTTATMRKQSFMCNFNRMNMNTDRVWRGARPTRFRPHRSLRQQLIHYLHNLHKFSSTTRYDQLQWNSFQSNRIKFIFCVFVCAHKTKAQPLDLWRQLRPQIERKRKEFANRKDGKLSHNW